MLIQSFGFAIRLSTVKHLWLGVVKGVCTVILAALLKACRNYCAIYLGRILVVLLVYQHGIMFYIMFSSFCLCGQEPSTLRVALGLTTFDKDWSTLKGGWR